MLLAVALVFVIAYLTRKPAATGREEALKKSIAEARARLETEIQSQKTNAAQMRPRRGGPTYVGFDEAARIIGVTQADMEDPNRADRDVVLKVSPSQPTNAEAKSGTQVIRFVWTNYGDAPVVCPNSWLLEIKGGGIKDLQFASGDIRVEPGTAVTVDFPIPDTTAPWRFGASYYAENLAFDAKVKLQNSKVKDYVPETLGAVQGKTVWTDWID